MNSNVHIYMMHIKPKYLVFGVPPSLIFISFWRCNQRFLKPCLTPHLLFIKVHKRSCSYNRLGLPTKISLNILTLSHFQLLANVSTVPSGITEAQSLSRKSRRVVESGRISMVFLFKKKIRQTKFRWFVWYDFYDVKKNVYSYDMAI